MKMRHRGGTTSGVTWLLALWIVNASAAPPDAFHEFEVELPAELRQLAGHDKASSIAHARVTIAVPIDGDLRSAPVLVVSATADPGYRSSRRLMRRYAETALAEGWIVVAADASEDVGRDDDTVSLRLALNMAALAVLGKQWPEEARAPLAFGGFSGGAKISGWLAAAFAAQGREVIGVYLGAINEETLVPAATRFKVLDTDFKRVPVFLQSGQKDDIATPADHRAVLAKLKRAGFENLRIAYFPGEHEIDPGPMRAALAWFRETAAK